jgi:hypothetical protein
MLNAHAPDVFWDPRCKGTLDASLDTPHTRRCVFITEGGRGMEPPRRPPFFSGKWEVHAKYYVSGSSSHRFG